MYESAFTTGDWITLVLWTIGILGTVIASFIKLQNEVTETKVKNQVEIDGLRSRIVMDEKKIEEMERSHKSDIKDISEKVDSNFKTLNAKIDQVLVILIEKNGTKKEV